jgi:hypothetical protein
MALLLSGSGLRQKTSPVPAVQAPAAGRYLYVAVPGIRNYLGYGGPRPAGVRRGQRPPVRQTHQDRGAAARWQAVQREGRGRQRTAQQHLRQHRRIPPAHRPHHRKGALGEALPGRRRPDGHLPGRQHDVPAFFREKLLERGGLPDGRRAQKDRNRRPGPQYALRSLGQPRVPGQPGLAPAARGRFPDAHGDPAGGALSAAMSAPLPSTPPKRGPLSQSTACWASRWAT